MDLTEYFGNADELAAYCLLQDNAAQDAALAERIAELSRNGAVIEGMQCTVQRSQQ
jgi:hypothetical protein